jgi:hypothetical protein
MIDLENDTIGLLPVSSGGTGAKNPDDARNELGVYGKDETHALLGGDVLWENPSPSDDFMEQTIGLDLAEYKSFYILFRSSNFKCFEFNFRNKGETYVVHTVIRAADVSRTVTITDTAVIFGPANNGSVNDNKDENDCVPLKIVGYKF